VAFLSEVPTTESSPREVEKIPLTEEAQVDPKFFDGISTD
jgi:hypothetical protein